MADHARRDERVSIPLDPETALRAFLRVKPNDPPAEPEPVDPAADVDPSDHPS